MSASDSRRRRKNSLELSTRNAVTATTIDEVIDRLDAIVENAYNARSRLGYFPALYRKVTVKVKEGIQNDFFADGPRMERLDVIFANRYLAAYDDYQRGRPVTRSWQVAFDTTKRWWPIVIQHILLGINAHINLDLGIAAARTGPGDAIGGLEDDFGRINDILGSLVDEVEDQLGRVWPFLRVLDWVGGRTDEEVVRFSMGKARDEAWKFAKELAPLEEGEQSEAIDRKDRRIADLGKFVRSPGPLIGSVTRLIRLAELRWVGQIIRILR